MKQYILFRAHAQFAGVELMTKILRMHASTSFSLITHYVQNASNVLLLQKNVIRICTITGFFLLSTTTTTIILVCLHWRLSSSVFLKSIIHNLFKSVCLLHCLLANV